MRAKFRGGIPHERIHFWIVKTHYRSRSQCDSCQKRRECRYPESDTGNFQPLVDKHDIFKLDRRFKITISLRARAIWVAAEDLSVGSVSKLIGGAAISLLHVDIKRTLSSLGNLLYRRQRHRLKSQLRPAPPSRLKLYRRKIVQGNRDNFQFGFALAQRIVDAILHLNSIIKRMKQPLGFGDVHRHLARWRKVGFRLHIRNRKWNRLCERLVPIARVNTDSFRSGDRFDKRRSP